MFGVICLGINGEQVSCLSFVDAHSGEHFAGAIIRELGHGDEVLLVTPVLAHAGEKPVNL